MKKLTFILFLLGTAWACGKSGLEDGTYTVAFLSTRSTCVEGCPTLNRNAWVISGGGKTVNTGSYATTIGDNASQVGWTEDVSTFDATNNCTQNIHASFDLTPSGSPVQGGMRITLTGCETCECDYQITLTKQ